MQVSPGDATILDVDTSCGSNFLPDLPSTSLSDKTDETVKCVSGDITKPSQRQFLEAHSTQNIAQMSKQKFAENYEKKIYWVIDLYGQWREYRKTDFEYLL